MARPLRIEYPGAVYHLTSRGNERRAIFTDDQDREGFLDLLHQVNRRYHWLCHAYCLMENHYHLLIETPEGNLSLGMRQLNGVYTQTFNRRHDRVGHLFQGRFQAVLIQKDSHLLEACRYIIESGPGEARQESRRLEVEQLPGHSREEQASPVPHHEWDIRPVGRYPGGRREGVSEVRAGGYPPGIHLEGSEGPEHPGRGGLRREPQPLSTGLP